MNSSSSEFIKDIMGPVYFEGDSETTLVNDSISNDTKVNSVTAKLYNSLIDKNEMTSNLNKELKRMENEIDKEIRGLVKKESKLKRANQILSSYENEIKTKNLIQKWRSICQSGMSYLLNSVQLKIDRMGGYQEYKRKEVDAIKRQIEYKYDDSLQQQMDEILESPDFFHLPEEEKNEIRECMDERIKEVEEIKLKELEKVEKKLQQADIQEMTLQELASKIKVDYDLVYCL